MPRRKPTSPPSRRAKRGKGNSRQSAKPRHGEGPEWFYGIHTVLAILANPHREYSRLLICDRGLEQRLAADSRLNLKSGVEEVSREELERIARLPENTVHQGIAILAAPLESVGLEDICNQAAVAPQSVMLVLDQVTDPHNIGAILRSAAAFEAIAVIVQDRHTPQVTGTMAKAASGGLELCPLVRVTNVARALEALKQAGVWCIGLDSEAAQTLAEAKVSRPTALVLGAEGEGLRRLTREHCDALARIPHAAAPASLNVSNAAAIALYETTRREPAPRSG